MKKKILMFTLLSIILVMPTSRVKAMRAWEFTSRNECPGGVELALAKTDGNLEKVACYENYYQARDVMKDDNREDLVIIKDGRIIDAKYAVVDYDVDFKPANTKYIRVFNSTTSNDEYTYIRSSQPDDAILLDFDYATDRIKIKVSGVIGWIDKYDNISLYDIVPLSWVSSPQSYMAVGNELRHYLPGNVYGANAGYYLSIDVKPEVLNNDTRYYSYDGHYFYLDMKTMIRDYKNNTYANSVNPNNPYYNFYQYMPFRTKTVYSADNINAYFDTLGIGESSKMYNTGEAFINAQNDYGINAVLMLAIGLNESDKGNSNIAQTKNNLFGLNAVDATPGQSSDYFTNVSECIKTYAYKWLSFGYSQPGDWRYRGSNLGNKIEGANLKYASDPFWGELASHYYYLLDKLFDFQERKQTQYNLGVLNNNYSNGVYAKKTVNGANVSGHYVYRLADSPVAIYGEEKDSNGVTWYKIQSEGTLTSDLSYIDNSTDYNKDNHYLWDISFVYVSSANFRKVTDAVTEYPNYDTSGGATTPVTVTQTVSMVVTKTGYRYEVGMISGINLNTDSNSVINALTSKGASNVSIKDTNGNSKTGALATGDKITMTVADKTETITVVIAGDTDGDGNMSAMDYVNIKNHIMESHSLGGAYLKAADVDRDGSISAVDYVSVKNYIMNQ